MKPSAVAEWRANWPVVVAAAAGMGVASFHVYSIGVMIAPLEREFGWTRAQISSGLFINSLFAVVFSPFVGMAIDRVGPRRIGLIGIVVYCSAFGLLSQASSSLWLWWGLWSLLAIGYLFLKPTAWVAAIASLFVVSRGLALAVALCASGVSALVTPLITYSLVEHYGWRTTYMVMGWGAAMLVLPLVFFCFSSADDRNRMNQRQNLTVRADLTGLTLREGLRSIRFYQLAAAVLITAASGVAVSINLVPILTLKGMSRGDAAGIAGVIGIAMVIGRLTCGYLLDRFNARVVTALAILLPIFPCTLLLADPISVSGAIVAVFVMGLAAGAELDATSYLSVRYFGHRSFGTLFGTIMGFLSFGVGVGPVLAGHVYDLTHSYDLVVWSFLGFSLLASILFLTLGEYPCFEPDEARRETITP